jgi:hypothetical protein
MADEGAVAGAGIIAKAGAAGIGGALWGIFASGLLVVPILLGSLFGPLFKKAHKAVDERVNTPRQQSKSPGQKMSKSDREYQTKMAELAAQKRQQDLTEELNRLKSKKPQKAKPKRANVSASI